MNIKIIVLTVLASSTLILTGCGGGGSAVVKPTPRPADFETAEYNNRYELKTINASTAYADGHTGAEVKVAILDDGIDMTHPDLAGNIDSGGYDFIDNDSNPDSEGKSHGTHIAGIIAGVKNDTGIHGIAYNAKILALRTLNSYDIERAIDRAINQGAKVMNSSFILEVMPTSTANKYLSAHNNDVVSVVAAGNDPKEGNPELPAQLPLHPGYEIIADTMIAVVATDSNNSAASFSNQCGDAKNWCMAAPGVGIYSTVDRTDPDYKGSSYGTMDGTSMAAPQVAGAAAVLRSQWPSKSAKEITTIIFDTATDLGVPGTDDIYGRGLLNLGNAVSAQGILTLYTPLGNTYSLSNSNIVTSAALGDSMSQSLETAVFDKYKRDYYFNLDGALQDLTTLDIATELSYNDSKVSIDIEPGVQFIGDYSTGSSQYNNDYKGLTISLAHKQDPSQVLGFNQHIDVKGISKQYSLYGDSYLSQINNASIASIATNGDVVTSLGVVSGYTDNENKHSITGVNFSAMSQVNSDLSLTAQVSHLNEKDTFLSNSFNGAFKTGSANTKSVNLIANGKLGNSLNIIGQYSKGKTSVNTITDSVVSKLSDINTEGYSVSLVKDNAGTSKGTLFATFKQPLKANTGDMTLSMANGLNLDDTISFSEQNLSLTPTGTEQQLTLGYLTNYGNDTDVTVLLNRRNNPNHNATANSDNAAMIKMTTRF